MKYLIISDIHGSFDSAKQIKKIFFEEKCDKILCLGDILYHGPRNDLPAFYNPKEVISILNELSPYIIAVKGNCEAYVDQMVLQFKIYNQKTMKIFGKRTLLNHGHLLDIDTKALNYDIILYGHTHINTISYVGNCLVVNPGSITIPKNAQKRSYAIWDNTGIAIYDLNKEVLVRENF